MRKYIKPKSLTWLASVVPLLAGVFIALEPIHELHEWVEAINAMFGNVPPAVLINAGLVGIGLRGAIQGG